MFLNLEPPRFDGAVLSIIFSRAAAHNSERTVSTTTASALRALFADGGVRGGPKEWMRLAAVGGAISDARARHAKAAARYGQPESTRKKADSEHIRTHTCELRSISKLLTESRIYLNRLPYPFPSSRADNTKYGTIVSR